MLQLDQSGSNPLLGSFWQAWSERASVTLSPLVKALVAVSFLEEEQVRSLARPDRLEGCHFRSQMYFGRAGLSHQEQPWTLQLEFTRKGSSLVVRWAQLLPIQATLKLTLAQGALENNERDEAVGHLLGLAKVCHGAGLREYAARVMNEVRARFPEHRERIKGMEDEPQTELSARLLEGVFSDP